jgi:hypothetical protein
MVQHPQEIGLKNLKTTEQAFTGNLLFSGSVLDPGNNEN